ncbi:hypothetical protein SDC49_13605 [Lactobacillus sp. R2/2]|nr:hypothetical protein [Lactobacillus sp. R2/2]
MSKARPIMTKGAPTKNKRKRLISAKVLPIIRATMHLVSQYLKLKGFWQLIQSQFLN